MGGHGQPHHRPDDGHGGGDQGDRDGQPETGQVGLEQAGSGGQGAAEGDQQTGPADEIKMKGEKTADDRDKEHPAPDSAQDGDNPHEEGNHQQNQRPLPPVGPIHGRSHGGSTHRLLCQGPGRTA